MNENDDARAIPPDGAMSSSSPAGESDGEMLAEALEAVEDAKEAAATAGKAAAPTESGAAQESKPVADADAPAASEHSGNYVYPDGGAASSQRMRLHFPEEKPASWWVRNRKVLAWLEWLLIGFFFLLTFYFLYLWLFAKADETLSWRVDTDPGRWKTIVVHHTATKSGTPASIDRYHREVNKWENGLGYHFLIGNGQKGKTGEGMPDGEVFVGGRWRDQLNGAHVRMRNHDNANAFSIGIALIGNFEEEPPTAKQLEALKRLLRFLTLEYSIPIDQIVGHGDVSKNFTACPGKHLSLNALVNDL